MKKMFCTFMVLLMSLLVFSLSASAEKYTEAYMVNWESNVFPGILGRTCDRPCEPACRRGRIEEEPVAICRLKRVAADNKGEVKHLMPKAPEQKNYR